MIHIQDGPLGLNDPNRRVFAGVWDTQNAASVEFDVSEWLTAWPGGTLRILVQRPGDEIPYPAEHVQVADGIAEWTFDAVDTAYAGVGSCALIYEVGGSVRARTEPYDLLIAPSLGPEEGDPPEPLERWYDDIIAAAISADQSAGSAARSAEEAGASADAAARSAVAAAASERDAAASALSARNSAAAAAESAHDAQTALEGMVFVTFGVDNNGVVFINNGELLGTTSFRLVPTTAPAYAGYLEVDY